MTDLERVVEGLRLVRETAPHEAARNVCNQAIALLEAGKWRPIETAPRDGRIVLLGRIGATRAYTGWWISGPGRLAWIDSNGQDRDPTHWQPLPPPPPRNQGGGE